MNYLKRYYKIVILLLVCLFSLTLTIKTYAKELSAKEKVDEELDSITMKTEVIANFPVVSQSVYNNKIEWSSDNEEIISTSIYKETGWLLVNRKIDETNTVKITVTITSVDETYSNFKEFVVTVKAGKTVTPLYNVTYVLPEGAINNNKTTYNAGTYNLLSNPALEGYYFDGWYTDSNFTNKTNHIPMGSGDVVLYANFIKIAVVDLEITNPNKMEYNALEEFDETGLVVSAVYNNNEKVTLSKKSSSNDGYEILYESEDNILHYGTDGKYNITIVYGSISKTLELTISKLDYNLSFSDKTVTYNGLEHNLEVIGLTGSLTVSYEITGSNVNAGTATFRAIFNNTDTDYNDPTELNAVLTINKAKLTIKPNDVEVFRGALINYSYSVSGLVNGEKAEEVLKNEPIYTLGAENASGECIISISGLDSDNYEIIYETGLLTYIASTINVKLVQNTFTYSKEYVELSFKIFDSENNDITDSSKLYVMDSETYTELTAEQIQKYITKSINAGVYTISLKATNELQGENEFTLTYIINKKSVQVNIENKESVYGDPLKELTYNAIGLIDGDSLNILLKINADEPLSSGEYDIVLEDNETNYEITYTPGKYIVTKKTVTIKLDDLESVYGDSLKDLTYNIEGLIDGDSISVEPYIDGQAKDVNEYVIKATIGENDNYAFVVTEGKYSITPRSLTLKINDEQQIYGEQKISEFSYGITSGNLVYSDTLTLITMYLDNEDDILNAGEYEIKGISSETNYLISFVSGKYNVSPKDISELAYDTINDFMYDGNEKTIELSLKYTLANEIIYTLTLADYDISYENNTGNENANTTAIAKVTGKGNFTGVKEINFVILMKGENLVKSEKETLFNKYDGNELPEILDTKVDKTVITWNVITTGVSVDELTGEVSFTITTPGEYKVEITASLVYTFDGVDYLDYVTITFVKTIEEANEIINATLSFPDENKEKTSGYTNNWTAKIGTVEWTIVNFNNNNLGWDYIKAGSKSSALVSSISNKTVFEKMITKVVVTVDNVTKSKINSLKLIVSDDSSFSNELEIIECSDITTGDIVFTIANPIANGYYKIEIDCAKGSSNGLIQISKVMYYSKNVTCDNHVFGDIIPEVSPSCTTSGLKAHYVCENCGKIFDEEKIETTLESLKISPMHSLEFVAEVEATCTSTGVKEHYKCSNCDKLFNDVNALNEIESIDLIIEKLEHTYVNGVCSSCGSEEKTVVEVKFYDGETLYTTCQVNSETSKVQKPDDPTKEGFTFDGWYLDLKLTDKFDFDTIITENTTLYAKWVEKTTQETITVIYTIVSTKSVSSTDALEGTEATFVNTYSTKDQLTSGNSATLTLTGYAGYKITDVVLSMHSNSSKGAGSLSITAGNENLAGLSSTNFNKWYGNNTFGTTYRDVKVTLTNDNYTIQTGENVVITITGTTNSLYIASYKITFAKVN